LQLRMLKTRRLIVGFVKVKWLQFTNAMDTFLVFWYHIFYRLQKNVPKLLKPAVFSLLLMLGFWRGEGRTVYPSSPNLVSRRRQKIVNDALFWAGDRCFDGLRRARTYQTLTQFLSSAIGR